MRGHVRVAYEKIPDRFQFFVGEDDDRGMSKRTESTDEVNIGLVRLPSKLISSRGARWPTVPIHDDKSDAGIVLQIRFARRQRGVHNRMPPSPADRTKNLTYLLLDAIGS